MTLKFVGRDKAKSGIGYKVVRRVSSSKDAFRPFFPYFLKSGYGGHIPPDDKLQSFMKDRVIPTHLFYVINEAARLRHKRFAHAFNEDLYHAGFHLWVELDYASERFFALRALDDNPESLVLIKCRWTGFLACDNATVVASRIIPLAEVNLREYSDEDDNEDV